jgi:hypothetical protein
MAVRPLFLSLLVLMGIMSLAHSRLFPRGTVRVFVLAGQSNMEGHGEVATINTSTGRPLNGTLLYQLHDHELMTNFKSYGILPTIIGTLSQMSKCGSTKLVKNRASMARTFPVSMERTTQPVP